MWLSPLSHYQTSLSPGPLLECMRIGNAWSHSEHTRAMAKCCQLDAMAKCCQLFVCLACWFRSLVSLLILLTSFMCFGSFLFVSLACWCFSICSVSRFAMLEPFRFVLSAKRIVLHPYDSWVMLFNPNTKQIRNCLQETLRNSWHSSRWDSVQCFFWQTSEQ